MQAKQEVVYEHGGQPNIYLFIDPLNNKLASYISQDIIYEKYGPQIFFAHHLCRIYNTLFYIYITHELL